MVHVVALLQRQGLAVGPAAPQDGRQQLGQQGAGHSWAAAAAGLEGRSAAAAAAAAAAADLQSWLQPVLAHAGRHSAAYNGQSLSVLLRALAALGHEPDTRLLEELLQQVGGWSGAQLPPEPAMCLQVQMCVHQHLPASLFTHTSSCLPCRWWPSPASIAAGHWRTCCRRAPASSGGHIPRCCRPRGSSWSSACCNGSCQRLLRC